MPKMHRKQIEEAVRRGEHVAVGPVVLRRDSVTRRADPAAVAAAFASPPDPDSPDEFEALIVRGPDGALTRAGMEHAIRQGGSVLIGGQVVNSLDELPSEVELAEGDRERLHAHAAALDAQIAGLAQQRQQAHEAAERALQKSQGEQPSPPGGAGEGPEAHHLRAAPPAPAKEEKKPPPLPEDIPAHPAQPKQTPPPKRPPVKGIDSST